MVRVNIYIMDVVLDRKTLGYSCAVGWKRVMVRRNINLVPGGLIDYSFYNNTLLYIIFIICYMQADLEFAQSQDRAAHSQDSMQVWWDCAWLVIDSRERVELDGKEKRNIYF